MPAAAAAHGADRRVLLTFREQRLCTSHACTGSALLDEFDPAAMRVGVSFARRSLNKPLTGMPPAAPRSIGQHSRGFCTKTRASSTLGARAAWPPFVGV